jgi:hypothetical protein
VQRRPGDIARKELIEAHGGAVERHAPRTEPVIVGHNPLLFRRVRYQALLARLFPDRKLSVDRGPYRFRPGDEHRPALEQLRRIPRRGGLRLGGRDAFALELEAIAQDRSELALGEPDRGLYQLRRLSRRAALNNRVFDDYL